MTRRQPEFYRNGWKLLILAAVATVTVILTRCVLP